MKNTLKISFLLTLIFFINSCSESIFERKYFDYYNYSKKSVSDVFSYKYPDTTLVNLGSNPSMPVIRKTTPGSGDLYGLPNWKLNPVFQMFIFDSDVIENTPWDTIVKYDMYLKRYQFTKEELEKINWEIIYDGN